LKKFLFTRRNPNETHQHQVSRVYAHYRICVACLSFLLKHLGIPVISCTFLAGIGCAWVGIGVIGIFIKRLKPEYIKKQEIQQKDERNIQIREKSGYASWLVTLFSLMILELVFLIIDNDVACMLTIGVMAVHIASFFVALFYYDKKL